jgi:hypothetical protein
MLIDLKPIRALISITLIKKAFYNLITNFSLTISNVLEGRSNKSNASRRTTYILLLHINIFTFNDILFPRYSAAAAACRSIETCTETHFSLADEYPRGPQRFFRDTYFSRLSAYFSYARKFIIRAIPPACEPRVGLQPSTHPSLDATNACMHELRCFSHP